MTTTDPATHEPVTISVSFNSPTSALEWFLHTPLTADAIDAVDLADPEASDTTERISIGFGDHYATLTSPDLVAVADAVRRLADRLIDLALDARRDYAEAQRRPCPGCDELIDPDVEYCGSRSCYVRVVAERRVEAVI